MASYNDGEMEEFLMCRVRLSLAEVLPLFFDSFARSSKLNYRVKSSLLHQIDEFAWEFEFNFYDILFSKFSVIDVAACSVEVTHLNNKDVLSVFIIALEVDVSNRIIRSVRRCSV